MGGVTGACRVVKGSRLAPR